MNASIGCTIIKSTLCACKIAPWKATRRWGHCKSLTNHSNVRLGCIDAIGFGKWGVDFSREVGIC